MHKTQTIKSIFVFLSYGLITQSLTTITSERTVVPQKNNTYEFHNDAARSLPKWLRALIGEYALDPSIYKIRAIYKHPSHQFAARVKAFDVNTPLTDPTCSYKVVTPSGESFYHTVLVYDLWIRDALPIVTEPIAHDGPLRNYSRTAIAKTCSNPHRLNLLFKYVLAPNEEFTSGPGVIVEAEQSDAFVLQRAGLHPVQSKYCSVLQCWQLGNCTQHR